MIKNSSRTSFGASLYLDKQAREYLINNQRAIALGVRELELDETTPFGLALQAPLLAVEGDEFIITTYGMALGARSYFGDFAIEFGRVPEPATNWLGLIAACALFHSGRARR